MGSYLDLDDAAAGHPKAEHELHLMREHIRELEADNAKLIAERDALLAEREAMMKQEPVLPFIPWSKACELEPLPAQQIHEKLDKPARVNATIFREGVSKRLVIEAAQRYYEWRLENPPESDEAFRNKVLDFIDGNQAQQIPEGYALVPIEPTDEMIEAAHEKFGYIGEGFASDHADHYKAMLSASQPKGE